MILLGIFLSVSVNGFAYVVVPGLCERSEGVPSKTAYTCKPNSQVRAYKKYHIELHDGTKRLAIYTDGVTWSFKCKGATGAGKSLRNRLLSG